MQLSTFIFLCENITDFKDLALDSPKIIGFHNENYFSEIN